MFEWMKEGKDYEIRPSSIVFCSVKSKLQSMNKEEADGFMGGLGNWTRTLEDDDLPLIIYGPNIINPETNGERDFRNNYNVEAISSGKEGIDTLIDFALQITQSDLVTNLRAEIEQRKIEVDGIDVPDQADYDNHGGDIDNLVGDD